jgi:hypothetical protein
MEIAQLAIHLRSTEREWEARDHHSILDLTQIAERSPALLALILEDVSENCVGINILICWISTIAHIDLALRHRPLMLFDSAGERTEFST